MAETSEHAAAAVVLSAARAHEFDRYLAALLAREPFRGRLLAIAAFAGEIAHIPDAVHEPMMGEIRLQWWREAIERAVTGEASGHPVVDALSLTMREAALPPALVLGIIDARSREVAGDPIADRQGLKSYLARTEGAVFALGARALGIAHSDAVEAAAAAAGQAFGLSRLLLRLERDLRSGRNLLPASELARRGIESGTLMTGARGAALVSLVADLSSEARQQLATARAELRQAPVTIRPAFLPLALVEPALALAPRAASGGTAQTTSLSPLQRIWGIWRAHVLRRI